MHLWHRPNLFRADIWRGKQALFASDFAEAAKYIERVLEYDPDNILLLERGVIVYLSMGDVDRAADFADLMETKGAVSSIAQIAQTVRDIKSENYNAVVQSVSEGRGVGPYADDLTAAWARLGQGDMSDALVSFDEAMTKDTVRIFVPFHKAMALASVGDYQSASEIFENEIPGSLAYSRRGLLAWAEILSQLGQNDKALQILSDHLSGRGGSAIALCPATVGGRRDTAIYDHPVPARWNRGSVLRNRGCVFWTGSG